MSRSGARAALPPLNPRAEASRINGAKSRGPRTAQGKARSSRNALKHGLRAETFVALGDEDQEAFEALEAALEDELAPQGVLQHLLVGRIARAAWRLERAERMEGELFGCHCGVDGTFGRALIRDGHGARAFETLLRYRGGATAELWRALRTLKALQAEARTQAEVAAETADEAAAPTLPASLAPGAIKPGPAATAPERTAHTARPKEPKGRRIAGDSARNPTARSATAPARLPQPPIPPAFPAPPSPIAVPCSTASLLAGTALARRADGFPGSHGPSNIIGSQG